MSKTLQTVLVVLLFLLIGMCGCEQARKPFIITEKYLNTGHCDYYYEDVNGYTYSFQDSVGKYDIGDNFTMIKNIFK